MAFLSSPPEQSREEDSYSKGSSTLRNILVMGGLSGLGLTLAFWKGCDSPNSDSPTLPAREVMDAPGPHHAVPKADQMESSERRPADVAYPVPTVDICASGEVAIKQLDSQLDRLAHDFGEQMLPLWEERAEQASLLGLAGFSGLDETPYLLLRSDVPQMAGSPGRQEFVSQLREELIERLQRTFAELEQSTSSSVRYAYDLADPPDTNQPQFRTEHGEPVPFGIWRLEGRESGKAEWFIFEVGAQELYPLSEGNTRNRISILAQCYWDNSDTPPPWVKPEPEPSSDEASPFFALDRRLQLDTITFREEFSRLLEERRQAIKQMRVAECPNTPSDTLSEDTLSWISSGMPPLPQPPRDEVFATDLRDSAARGLAEMVRKFKALGISPLGTSEYPQDIAAQVKRAQTSSPLSLYGIIRSDGTEGSPQCFIWKQEGPGQFELYRLSPLTQEDLVYGSESAETLSAKGSQLVFDYMWANYGHLGPEYLFPWEIGD